MINRGTSDRLDDAIDEFEETWSLDAKSHIESLLSRYGLAGDHESIAELIRIDIELRYEEGHPINVREYFDRFRTLMESPEFVAGIAYEDYRSRSANGHPVSPDRWQDLPGVGSESWFQQLSPRNVRNSTRRMMEQRENLEKDSALLVALEEAGFLVEQQIGSGARGIVFLARQSNLADRFVVLKVVTETLREPEHMARLQHTNIVPIYSFHRILSRSVICMPYAGSVTMADIMGVDGDSVDNGQSLVSTVMARVQDTRLAVEQHAVQSDMIEATSMIPAADDQAVLKPLEHLEKLRGDKLATWIFSRLAAALEHSHARGILHNDLKPSNILIRNDGEPALIDFNLSRSLDAGSAKQFGGTLPYMSPETLQSMMGKKASIEAPSDLYSIGVILFEFVTGRLPYLIPKSLAEVDLQAAIDARKGEPDWREGDNVNPGLKAIILQCLQFHPADRYQLAGDLHFDLHCEHLDMGLAHTNEPMNYRFRKWRHRNPRLVTGALVACALFGFIIPLLGFWLTARAQSAKWSSLAQFRSFAQESDNVLSTLMADPKRRESDGIEIGMQPLEKFDVLNQEGIKHLLAHEKTHQETRARETLFRHLAHVSIFEADRLTQLKSVDQLKETDFQRLDQLISSLSQVVDVDRSRTYQFLVARQLDLKGNVHEAAAAEQAAQKLNLNNDSESYLEAVRCLSQGRVSRATELLVSLADRNSVPSALRWTALGRSQFQQGKYADAALSFSQSIDRAPTSSTLHVLRGLSHRLSQQPDKALQDFQRAVHLDAENQLAWTHLAVALESRKDFEGAIDACNRILAISPGNAYALIQRSRFNQEVGEEEKADADYEASMNDENVNVNSLLVRAKAREKRQDIDGALEDIELALRKEPNRVSTLMAKARLQGFIRGDKVGAIETYTRVLSLDVENQKARIDRAVMYFQSGQVDKAISEVKDIFDSESVEPRTIYQAACIYAQLPEEIHKREAIRLLADAIRHGYPSERLLRDTDLDSLRKRDGFQSILLTCRLAKTSGAARGRTRQSTNELGQETTHLPHFNREAL